MNPGSVVSVEPDTMSGGGVKLCRFGDSRDSDIINPLCLLCHDGLFEPHVLLSGKPTKRRDKRPAAEPQQTGRPVNVGIVKQFPQRGSHRRKEHGTTEHQIPQ